MAGKPNNQGKGDSESARRYNEPQQAFVEEGSVEEAIDDRCEEMTDKGRREVERAENIGKSSAKERDLDVKRDFTRGGGRAGPGWSRLQELHEA